MFNARFYKLGKSEVFTDKIASQKLVAIRMHISTF